MKTTSKLCNDATKKKCPPLSGKLTVFQGWTNDSDTNYLNRLSTGPFNYTFDINSNELGTLNFRVYQSFAKISRTRNLKHGRYRGLARKQGLNVFPRVSFTAKVVCQKTVRCSNATDMNNFNCLNVARSKGRDTMEKLYDSENEFNRPRELTNKNLNLKRCWK